MPGIKEGMGQSNFLHKMRIWSFFYLCFPTDAEHRFFNLVFPTDAEHTVYFLANKQLMVLMHNIYLYISVTFLQVNCTVWSFTWFFSQNLVKFILRSRLSAHDYIVISSWKQWSYDIYILRSISFSKIYICMYFRPLLEFLSFFILVWWFSLENLQ